MTTSRRIAVIDVETTGFSPYRHDRVLEVAALLLTPSCEIDREFITLVNPERDVGPTSIHGLRATDLTDAPVFPEIAAPLAQFLGDSSVLAGHNIRFDLAFLQAEYKRVGIEMPRYDLLDTMLLAGGGTLSACCAKRGIQFHGAAHSALVDAHAAARLLYELLPNVRMSLTHLVSAEPPPWPAISTPSGRLTTRKGGATQKPAPASLVSELARTLSLQSSPAVLGDNEVAYRGLLWHVLEDGQLDKTESESLASVAHEWGLGAERVRAIHIEYLARLVSAALADQRISEAERDEIRAVAKLLGFGALTYEQLSELIPCIDSRFADSLLARAAESLVGKSVCFTGESACTLKGQLISRELAEGMARERGLHLRPNVTKKLDLLVVSDPNTQSSKARKAREYGTRIIYERAFWRMLGIEVD